MERVGHVDLSRGAIFSVSQIPNSSTREVTAQDALPVDPAAKKAFLQDIAEQVFSLG
jgi:hypothetical protein